MQRLSQILEEVGIKPRRFASASAGSMIAALASAGYSSRELEEVLKLDLEELLMGKYQITLYRSNLIIYIYIYIYSFIVKQHHYFECFP